MKKKTESKIKIKDLPAGQKAKTVKGGSTIKLTTLKISAVGGTAIPQDPKMK
jgi:hypothetical protein